jgi:predicted lipoprotein with Yx(FWY)xxD motif
MKRLDERTKLQIPMSRLFAIVGILASLALAACGGDDDPTPTTGPAPAAEGDIDAAQGAAVGDRKASGGGVKEQTGSGTEVVASDSQYGSVLFDSEQQAIYLFDREASDTSECYGACAEAWPPVLTDGDPQAGEGVDAKLLATTERDDGSTQVTYDGHPLYYYVDDPPGEVLCHGVEEFGGLWLAVDPSGKAVQ